MRGSPPTPQSRKTAARKRRQLQRLTAQLIADAQARPKAMTPIPATVAPTATSLLDAILAGHSIRRV